MRSIYMDDFWLELQQKKENGLGVKYSFESDNGSVVYPFIKRKAGLIDGVQYYDIATPRGQGGPQVDLPQLAKISQLMAAYESDFKDYCKKENIIAEYIRFDPWNKQSDYFKDIYDISPYGHLYCNDLTKNFFAEEYSATSRKAIRKAQKNGVTIQFDFEGDTLNTFLNLYEFTIDKNKVGQYYLLEKDYLEDYFKLLKGRILISNAIFNNEIIASVITLLGDDIAHYHYLGSNPEYSNLQPNSMMIYETSLYAAECGKKLMDLGGAKSGSSLERFKRNFVHHGKAYLYDVGIKVQNKIIYDILVEMSGGPRIGYFPEYR